MNMHPHRVLLPCILGTLITLPGCGNSSSSSASSKPVTPDYEPDTSYLDTLAEDKGIETQADEPEQSPAVIDQTKVGSEEPESGDEEREWVKEEGSKSIFGRSRDKARDVTQQLQGGTEPEEGLANTIYDEEYAQAAGYAWDMPEDWRMAVPSAGHFAEMYIQHPLGNASVVFSKTEKNAAETQRELKTYITDTFGSGSPKTSTKTIKGFKVTFIDLDGTYIDPSGKGGRNESPFYAIHAALIELPTTKVLVRMWGPQDTVNQNKGKFDAMIEKMYEK